MAEAACESDATAGVAFNYRYIPAIQVAKRMLDDGEFGEIRRFKGQYLQTGRQIPTQNGRGETMRTQPGAA